MLTGISYRDTISLQNSKALSFGSVSALKQKAVRQVLAKTKRVLVNTADMVEIRKTNQPINKKSVPLTSSRKKADQSTLTKPKRKRKKKAKDAPCKLTKEQKERVERNIDIIFIVLAKLRIPRGTLKWEEGFSIGAEALCEAAKRYNPKRKTKFSTFAQSFIEPPLSAWSKTPDSVIHVKQAVFPRFAKLVKKEEIRNIIEKFLREGGIPPKDVIRKIANETGIPEKTVESTCRGVLCSRRSSFISGEDKDGRRLVEQLLISREASPVENAINHEHEALLKERSKGLLKKQPEKKPESQMDGLDKVIEGVLEEAIDPRATQEARELAKTAIPRKVRFIIDHYGNGLSYAKIAETAGENGEKISKQRVSEMVQDGWSKLMAASNNNPELREKMQPLFK